MITQCNRWLKRAFIEAVWVAIGCNGYLGAQFKRQQARGNKPNNAITIVCPPHRPERSVVCVKLGNRCKFGASFTLQNQAYRCISVPIRACRIFVKCS
jgi:hypothetical protein